MLRRIYIDNYKCLVNFELPLDQVALLLGSNASGKSSIFEVLASIRSFMSGDTRARDCFPPRTLTRWETRGTQTFETEVEGPDGLFVYRLVIEHDQEQKRAGVETEELRLDGRPLFRQHLGETQLFRDNHSEGPKFPSDSTRCGLAGVPERADNTRLAWFRSYIRRLLVVSLKPDRMQAETSTEDERLASDGANFASWYRYLIQEFPGSVFNATAALQEVLERLEGIRLEQAGRESRTLQLDFGHDGLDTPVAYRFDELSDGQRALVALYTMITAGSKAGTSLFIDEPDNYVALAELQPWLMALNDALGEQLSQAVIVSHHPELIDYLGPDCGVLIQRTGNGPTRVGRITPPPPGAISLSETIARGWEDGEA